MTKFKKKVQTGTKNAMLEIDDYVYIDGKIVLTREYYIKRDLAIPKSLLK